MRSSGLSAVALAALVAAAGERGVREPKIGPRIVLTPEHLAEMDEDGSGRMPGLGRPPYWVPTAAEIRAIEDTLLHGPQHFRGRPDTGLERYALQFSGVTIRGVRRVVVDGICPFDWERDARRSWASERTPQRAARASCYFTQVWYAEDGLFRDLCYEAFCDRR